MSSLIKQKKRQERAMKKRIKKNYSKYRYALILEEREKRKKFRQDIKEALGFDKIKIKKKENYILCQ